MARRSIRDIRRQELSDAAIEVLIEHGLRGTTVERVAKLAGASKGIVLHNFKDKDALFEAVLRKSNALLRDAVVELFGYADCPEDRLFAIIVGNFSPAVFQQDICRARINLCADVPHNAQSQRIQTIFHARMRSNLFSALRPLAAPGALESVAMQITTLMDGIWLRAGLQKEPMESKAGIDLMEHTINLLLQNDAEAANRLHAARHKMESLAEIVLKSRVFKAKAKI